jgi:ribosome biogenesis protein MAK21
VDVKTAAGEEDKNDRLLVFWWFEDALKRRFADFVAAMEQATHDTLTHVRSKVVRVAFDLLRSKPEQEQAALFLLVNKLGDPDKLVACKVSHLLGRLLEQHGAMKQVNPKP